MFVAPVTIGVLLIVSGGLVLLWSPGRPGRDGRFQAVGVGLPLIVLGLVAVVVAALQVESGVGPGAAGVRLPVVTGSPRWAPGPKLPDVPSPADAGACLASHLDQDPRVDKAFQTEVRAGQTIPITGGIDSALILAEPVGPTGAVRFRYTGAAGELTLTIYEVVDASCQPGRFTSQEMANGFLVHLALADRAYELSVTYVDHPLYPAATLRRTG